MNAKHHQRTATLKKLKRQQNRHRLWLVAEHPLMASGAGALLLAAVALELSRAVKIAAVLYICADLLLVIVFFRAGYLQHNRRTAAAILIVLAIVLLTTWKALLPAPALSSNGIAEQIEMSTGGQIHVIQRKLIGPGRGLPYAFVNLQFQARGDQL